MLDGDKLFDILHELSASQPEFIEVTVDDNGELEFELDYEFFIAILQDSKNE